MSFIVKETMSLENTDLTLPDLRILYMVFPWYSCSLGGCSLLHNVPWGK